jgi:hypothetical protein
MTKIDFRKVFFYDLMSATLGYKPWIEIRPAHLANGLFGAVCGGYVNNKAQHVAIYPKATPINTFESELQEYAFSFLERHNDKRDMLHYLFSADKTVFKAVSTSSYSLSHANHVTSDNHDRDAGKWLCEILSTGQDKPALDLLRELLLQEPRKRNDELAVLTLPLEFSHQQRKAKQPFDPLPTTLEMVDGQFHDPLVREIRTAFDQLARNDMHSARQNGKLDTLRRITTLGCFAIYLHLMNSGNNNSDRRIPLLMRIDKSGRTLHQASIATYRCGLRSIDTFVRETVRPIVEKYSPTGGWSDDVVQQFICTEIDWFRNNQERNSDQGRDKVQRFQDACWQFYQSYRSGSASFDAVEALVYAITNTLGIVLSSTPQDIARALGTRIGLLGPYEGNRRKSYLPHPDLLEILVRSIVPQGDTWPLRELARQWADRFGIFCGVLGDENDSLQQWDISLVDRAELAANEAALTDMLTQSGYARRYADGVVLVHVGG